MNLGLQTPDAARVFHALGDPTRRAIIERLGRGPQSVSGLAGPLGITLSAVSQHLQVLEDSALVRTQKSGRVRTCAIQTEGFNAAESWIRSQRSLWEERLDRLGNVLDEDPS